MNEERKNVSETAVDKLTKEIEKATKACSGSTHAQQIKRCLATEIGNMMIKFCYQNDEFAQAVERCEKELLDLVNEISKKINASNPSLSDVSAYAEAVKFYLPAAQVIASFRVFLPNEQDDDLLFYDELDTVPEDNTSSAIILDIFDTEEE